MLNEILNEQIKQEHLLLKTIDELQLDDVSKLQIRERTYAEYRRYKALIEMDEL
jgi:hypothetical protein